MEESIEETVLLAEAKSLFQKLANLPVGNRIRILNRLRLMLHAYSPFREEPVDCVLWVDGTRLTGNDYNPNTVAPPEMHLLAKSIEADGYTQPIVVYQQDPHSKIDLEIVDGFHRMRVGTENRLIRRRLRGYLPVTLINAGRGERSNRMAATIRHNRARGVHGVIPMTQVVSSLVQSGWNDSEIAAELGMDIDEILRFKQTAGLPGLFKDHPYSRGWE
jgi:ParB-like chromosome segregation protein Spo0J